MKRTRKFTGMHLLSLVFLLVSAIFSFSTFTGRAISNPDIQSSLGLGGLVFFVFGCLFLLLTRFNKRN